MTAILDLEARIDLEAQVTSLTQYINEIRSVNDVLRAEVTRLEERVKLLSIHELAGLARWLSPRETIRAIAAGD